MAPEVLLRKLGFLRQLLEDLAAFRGASSDEVAREHYKLERLFELLGTTAGDTVQHLLAERGLTPESYRDAFRLAAEHGLLPADLAASLQEAAGMRNVLVHLYEQIDLEILRASIEPALRDFHQFVAVLEARLSP
ncbi:MAG TPA: DUF86 domain-containing protein [Thermoanaerobaculia bacterium]|jgi:uncharacterized protein YutE (UPF0331/DUF86 family)